MRKKKGFTLRKVCGENIIISEGIENIDFSKLISMNESAAFLWNSIDSADFNIKDIANLLISEYQIDEKVAEEDAKKILDKWLDAQIIE